jgi:uncharacterized membrane protein
MIHKRGQVLGLVLFYFSTKLECINNHSSEYTLVKGVATMLVKINKKPIKVVDESEEQQEKSWFYFCVSSVGYLTAIWLLDYCCHVFFYIHPFPFVAWLGRLIFWLI